MSLSAIACRERRSFLPGALLLFALFVSRPGLGAAPAEPVLDLASLHGRVVYLDFWASWCAPCRLSFPWMQALQTTYAPQGLTVVAVNVDRERRAADRFLAQYPVQFDLRFDPEGSLAEAYQVHGMPTSVLIDRQGKVRYTHIGFRAIDGAIYERQVRELLEEK
jgi:thiol-disulfide isomerase/thioredoxin